MFRHIMVLNTRKIEEMWSWHNYIQIQITKAKQASDVQLHQQKNL